MRTLPRTSVHLLLPALLLAAGLTYVSTGSSSGPPAHAEPYVDGVLQKIKSFPTSEHGIRHPSGMVWSERLDALLLADARTPDVRRAVRPDETPVGSVHTSGDTGADGPPDVQGAEGHDLRGRTRHPETGELFTYDATDDRVLAIRHGAVTKVYDAGDLEVEDVRGIVLAPSADPTDHASTLSFYVVDNGAAGSWGEVVEATVASDFQLVADVTPTSVRTVQTSAFNPPSPDPSGLAYLPGVDRLFISDGEVDEMSIFRNANLFTATRPGALTATGTSQPWSDEPVGVGYNSGNNHLYVTDDDLKSLFELTTGADGRFGTADDGRTTTNVQNRGVRDPEGVDYDPGTNSLWFAGGEAADLHRLQAGGDGRFGTFDDVWTHWDAGVFGAQDPEGLGFDAARGTVLLLDDSSDKIYELTRDAALVNTIDTGPANMRAAAGLAVAPASNGSGERTYYVVARGQDNDSNPSENDGRLYEITASLPPIGGGSSNQAPVVDAGTDDSIVLPASASLDGTVSDDGLPANPGEVTSAWSVTSGPGDVTFGDPSAVDTTASFSQTGTYVLRLAASDGALTTADEVTVFVAPAGGAIATERRIAAGSDDAEQSASGAVNLTSSDIELTTDGNTQQVVGLRFPNLQVPRGAEILRTYVQFTTDEISTGAANLTIRAQAADNAPTFASTSQNISARSWSTTSASWTPPEWPTVGQAGAAQQTSDLSTVLQSVVDRAGWTSGNAVALQVTGTGRRNARAFEAGATVAPLLRIEYTTGGTSPTNEAPTVDAGPDLAAQLPASASLDGTVTDDGLPSSPGAVSTTWSRVSGPGTVTFGNAAATDTTATFSAAGTYVLRLTADDGDLSTSDDVTITVAPASPTNAPPTVDAGADASVQLPAAAVLDGTVGDDGLPTPPGTVTSSWTRVSGPGTVTFADASAVDTTATFSAAGSYVLRLTASDGQASTADDVTITVTPASQTNAPPTVDAGSDATTTLPASATLDGTITDDGLPNPPGTVTSTWSRVSGPGTVTFGDDNATDTTASFSAAGTYVLQLSASDGQLSGSDDVTIQVAAAPTGGSTTVERRIVAGSDDAEQRATGANDVGSSDLELTTDGSSQQVIGLRFSMLAVPAGATITNAYVQFTADEVSTGASSMTIRAEAVDNAPTYAETSNNVTSRATTTASVSWTPPDWPTVNAVTTAQRTPNLASLVQAVVSRPGWQGGNALALQISGTGRRTADAFEGGAAVAPLLHIEYTGGVSGPINQPPSVDAGPNRGITLPDSASLDGNVSDDGLPAPASLATTWSQVSGPGDVTFTDAAATDTTAAFSLAGTYVLRLTASDGQLSASDQMTVVAQAADGGGGAQVVELRVTTGASDAEQSVGSGKTALTSSDLELTTDGNTQQVVGIRIANVPVPAGATVTSAYLQFTTDEVSTGASSLTLRAEDADNAAPYTNTLTAVTGRALTTAQVPWAPPEWTTVGQAGTAQRTPDLAGLVQAVVGRAGWVPGNAIAFQVSGTGVRRARAFEAGAATAPLLHLEYTTG